MLTLLRNLLRSKIALVLIGLLILGLAAFGITDIFTPRLGNSLVRVGDRTIEARDIDREADAQIDQMNAQGGSFTRQDLADSGRLVNVIAIQVNRLTMAEYLKQKGLSPSDEAVVDQLRQLPLFRSSINGSFDLQRYQQYLNSVGQTEAEYEQLVEDQLSLVTMSRGFSGAVEPPSALSEIMATYNGEERRIAYMLVGPDQIEDQIEPPTEEELRTFYQEQRANLLQPERRAFSIIAISPSDFIHRVDITDEEIQNEYAAQIARFSAPSTRVFESVVFEEQEPARQALGRLLADADFDQVVNSLSGQIMAAESVLRDDMTNEDLADTVFTAPVDIWSGPVELGDGRWAIINVIEETPGEAQPIENVSDVIEQELRAFKAERAYMDSLEEIDDATGSGLSLEELAEVLQSPAYSLPPVDNQGVTEDGKRNTFLNQIEGAIDYGFDLYPDETSFRQDAGDYQYIIRLDEIVEGYLPEFEEVEDRLTRALTNQKRAQALNTLATEVADRLDQGGFLTSEAETLGVEVMRPDQPVTRSTPPETGLNAHSIQSIFAAGLDESFVIPLQGGLMIGVVEAINLPDGDALRRQVAATQSQLSNVLSRELEQAMFAVAMDDVSPETNDAAIETYISDNQSPQ